MTPTPEFNAALAQVVQALAGLLVVVIGMLTSYVTLRASQWLDAKKKEVQWATLITLGTAVVQSVEQSALKGVIEDTAIAKKNEAIKQLQALADSRGIKVDLSTMDTIIEALLLQGIHKGLEQPSTPVTPTPATVEEHPKG